MKNISIQGYGITDKGLIRPTNEDYYALDKNLFLIADGMGGHRAGEIASRITVESILMNKKDFFKSNSIGNEPRVNYMTQIIRMISNANMKVIQEAKREPRYIGMGTTIVMALFQKPNTMHIANVGDSRAYLFRKKQLRIISEDHSLAKVMMYDFDLNQEEIQHNRYQNYLTRAIGINSKIEPYYTSISLIPGDKILLCSDGLWNMITDKEIINVLQKNKSDELLCKELIEKANESGGIDNITTLLISTISQ
ncbi:MAG: Stp1/IreP family PP2C-type Ser/Thr phosphatase [Candidatus Thermoplasmatota archaeon]|nr:Stp1/IreP family PP2C-type Ser/Thr phosphatase [Candidatus Thermoplasmatota archaeon]